MRHARISFIDTSLMAGNITAKDLLEIIELLPDNAKIYGLSSVFHSNQLTTGTITIESDYFVDIPLGIQIPEITCNFSATSTSTMVENLDYGQAFDQNVVGGKNITLLCGNHHYFPTLSGFDGKIYASGARAQSNLPSGNGSGQSWTPTTQASGIYTLPGFGSDPEQLNFNFDSPAPIESCQHTYVHYQGFSESYNYCTKCDKRQ